MGTVYSIKQQQIMGQICAITSLMKGRNKACHMKGVQCQVTNHLSKASLLLPQEEFVQSKVSSYICLFATNVNGTLFNVSSTSKISQDLRIMTSQSYVAIMKLLMLLVVIIRSVKYSTTVAEIKKIRWFQQLWIFPHRSITVSWTK